MGTTTKKITEELVAPKIPGAINKDAVKTAAAGVQDAKNAVENMTYDNFKGGSLYRGLQRDYQQQGQQAMKDTLGQIAARTGGMASSYAITAANQSYNNYMKILEDAARSMYADEYSRAQDRYGMAQQEYANAYGEYRDNVGDAWTRYNAENDAYWKNKNYNYQVGRDEIKDQRYNDTQTKERVATQKTDLYKLVASGGTPNRNDYPNLTNEDYSIIVATATGNRTDANRLNVDKEFESIFGAEGFDWDNYDWNGDGKVDETDSADDYDFSGSSYGADYWQQKYNDSKVESYTYQNTPTGRNDIISTLTNSASLSLSDKDQKNFDYLFGDGAYEAITNAASKARNISTLYQDAARDFDVLYEDLIHEFPTFTTDQIMGVLYMANPEAYEVWAK